MSQTSPLALVAALAALGLSAYAVFAPNTAPTQDARIEALESEVAELRDELRINRADSPLLEGSAGANETIMASGTQEATPSAATRKGLESSDPTVRAEAQEALRTLVDASVAKKAEEVARDMQVKANKKPAFDVLSETLELNDAQRKATQEEVLRGQREAFDVLKVPADDGGNFYDEIIEAAAQGIAKPGANGAAWTQLIGRLMTERIPGTDETYAKRIEGIKTAMRANFKNLWTPAQHAEYTAWAPDPIEISGLSGGAREELTTAITDRARELGVDLPRK